MNDPKSAPTPESLPPISPDPIELAMESVNSSRPPDGVAHKLLVKQTRLVSMQIQQMLLWRVLGLGLGLLVLAVVAAAVWSAARDSSLVIEAFSAPPDLEAQGLGGEVLAGQMLDKLAAMDAQTDSFRSHATLTNDWSEIKVQIPETGVSIGQVDRALRSWLGHQIRVAGSVFHRGDTLAVTVRVGGSSQTFSGPAPELDRLLQQAAEAVYSATQPDQFSKYLEQHGRVDEALAVARKDAASGPAFERAWAYAQVSDILYLSDVQGSLVAGRKAVALDPDNALAWLNLSGAETLLGHDEDGWRHIVRGARLAESGRGGLSDAGVAFGALNRAESYDMDGDFAAAVEIFSSPKSDFSYTGYTPLLPGLKASDMAKLHDVSGAKAVADVLPDTDLVKYLDFWNLAFLPAYERSAALADWPAALADLDAVLAAVATQGYLGEIGRQRFLQPMRAVVLAQLGRVAEARQATDSTPADCYRCLRARAIVESAAGDAEAADHWFAESLKLAPSLPFAYSEWGQAKLARADAPGAIALFRQAQEKSPRWADPLKLEGDALLKQGDARAAAGRYRAAAELAPKWGGLYLAWGEALEAQGRKAEAADQYRAASALDLSAKDRVELAQRLR